MSRTMELFTMGPKRGRDQDGRDEPVVSLEPLELGSSAAEAPEAEETEDLDVVLSQHWWGDLVRPDVLAVASAAAVAVSVLGLPFAQFLTNLFYSPVAFSTAWTFLPNLVAAGIATVLGLCAVRQGFRHDAATWIRVVGGAATLIAFLLLLGTAITWLYVADAGLMDDLRNFY